MNLVEAMERPIEFWLSKTTVESRHTSNVKGHLDDGKVIQASRLVMADFRDFDWEEGWEVNHLSTNIIECGIEDTPHWINWIAVGEGLKPGAWEPYDKNWRAALKWIIDQHADGGMLLRWSWPPIADFRRISRQIPLRTRLVYRCDIG